MELISVEKLFAEISCRDKFGFLSKQVGRVGPLDFCFSFTPCLRQVCVGVPLVLIDTL